MTSVGWLNGTVPLVDGRVVMDSGGCCAGFCGDTSGNPGALCRSLTFDVELFEINYTGTTSVPFLFGLPELSGDIEGDNGPYFFRTTIECHGQCSFLVTLEIWHSGDLFGTHPPTETWTATVPIDCDGCPRPGLVGLSSDDATSALIIDFTIAACP